MYHTQEYGYQKPFAGVTGAKSLACSRYNTVDMSIAVATDNGLITPIVTSADRKVFLHVLKCIYHKGEF